MRSQKKTQLLLYSPPKVTNPWGVYSVLVVIWAMAIVVAATLGNSTTDIVIGGILLLAGGLNVADYLLDKVMVFGPGAYIAPGSRVAPSRIAGVVIATALILAGLAKMFNLVF